MASKIGAKIALDGEKEFRRAITAINKDLKVQQSELAMTGEKYKSNANSMEALQSKTRMLAAQYDLQTQKIEATKNALANAQANYQRAGNRVEELKRKLADATKEMAEMEQGSTATSEEIKKQQDVIKELEKELSGAQQVYQKCDNKVDEWKVSLNDAEKQLYSLSGEIDKNKSYLREAEKTTDHTANSIDEYGREVQEATQKTNVFGDVLKANLVGDAIVSGIKAIGRGIRELSGGILQAGMDFESSMSQVAATMGITSQQIQAGSRDYKTLEDAAKECGATTKYTAAQAGEALNYLALAGYNAEKAAKTLPETLNMAAAGGMDLAYASDLVTDSMGALGIETGALTGFVDQMAKTSQKSNTSIAQLGEGILQVGGTAKTLQGGVIELNTSLGILADNGIKGAEGGTKLRNMILSLSAPTDKAAAKMKSLSYSALDIHGNLKPLNQAFGELDQALAGLSKGERTQALKTIFNKTDLKAVNALMANCTARFDELSGQIEDCDGAAADMAETMNNNLRGKVTILQSALEGLGITTFEKFEKPLKRATESATQSVERLNRSMTDGKLGDSFNRLGESVGEAAEGLIRFAETALPGAINGLAWIIDNSGTIISGLTGIGAAMLTYKAAEGVIRGVEALRAFKTATEGATLAQLALNAAQGANPIGLLVAGIAGVTAALAIHNATTDKTLSEYGELVQKCKDVKDQTKQLREEMGELDQKRKDSTAEAEKEARTNEILAEKLYDLSGQEKQSAEDKLQMLALVKELNKRLPELNLNLDKQTGELSKQKAEVMDLINANKDLYIVKALEEDYTEIARKQAEAEKQLSDLTAEREEKQQQLNAAKAEHNRLAAEYDRLTDAEMEKGPDLLTQMQEQNQQMDVLSAELEKLDDTINPLNKTVEECGTEWEKTNKLIAEHGGVEDTTQAIEDMGDTATEASDAAATAVQNLRDEYNKSLSDTQKEIRGTMGLFDEFAGKSKVSGEQLIKNLQSQVQGLKDWQKNIKNLSKRCGDDFVQQLKDMGVGSAGEIAALAKMTDEQLEEYEKLWREKTKQTKKAAVLTHSEMKQEIAEKNKEIVKEAKKSAEKVPKEWAEGIEAGSGDVEKAAQKLVEAAVKQGKGTGEKGKEIGKNYALGVAKGITLNQGPLIAAITTMMSAGHQAAKKEAEIHSPSKKAEREIGMQYAAGVAKGVEKGRYQVIDAISNVGEMTLEQAKKWLDRYKVYNQMSLQEEVVFWKQIQKQYKKGTDERTEIDKSYYEAKESLNKKLVELEEAYKESTEKINAELGKNIDDLTKKYEDAVTARAEAIAGSMSLFQEFETKTEETGESLLTNLQSQVEGLTTWQDTIDGLKGRIQDTDLLKELSDLGPSALGELQALNQLTDEQLSQYVELWREKQKLAREAALAELKPMKEDTEKQIQELVSQAMTEMKKQRKEYVAGLKGTGVSISILDDKNLQKEMKQAGQKAIKSLSTAAAKKAKDKETQETVGQVNKAVTGKLKEMPVQAHKIGADITKGLISGIQSQKAALQEELNAVIQMVNQINSARASAQRQSTNAGNGSHAGINQTFNISGGVGVGAIARTVKQAAREAAREL